jgi:hypothetical protein
MEKIMTRTLGEVLHEYAVKYHGQVEQLRARKQEWIDSVGRLMDQFRQWLQEADKEGVLRLDKEVHELGEEGLGWYEVPGITVLLGDRRVRIRAVGRNTIGRITPSEVQAQGRVDMTNGTDRCILYRVLDDQGERWVIYQPDTGKLTPLAREAFEATMARMLE